MSPEGSSISVPGVHTGAIVAAHDPAAVVAAIAAEDTRIVSLTVTEHGYCMDPSTHRLALDSPGHRRATSPTAPHPAPPSGRSRAHWSAGREHARRPITVLSCDNMQSNGTQTRGLVLRVPPGTAGSRAADWVAENVTFPNSMVDRIVPATTDAYRAAAYELLGVDDRSPVPAEPFTMWVMEDRFAAGRPAWERAGAVFTDEVEAVRADQAAAAQRHPLADRLPRRAGRPRDHPRGACPGLHRVRRPRRPRGRVPAERHRCRTASTRRPTSRQLFERWSNAALGHRTQQVGTDGSVKLPQRVPMPALRLLGQGVMPEHLALTVAAWLCCVVPLPGFDPGPHARAMVDPARDAARRARGDNPQYRGLVRPACRPRSSPLSLLESNDFVRRIAEYVAVISTVTASAAAAREAARSRTRHQPQASPAA